MGDASETPVSPADVSIEYDEEEVFWERFFERLAPVRDSVINALIQSKIASIKENIV